jgi:hypothetical protein
MDFLMGRALFAFAVFGLASAAVAHAQPQQPPAATSTANCEAQQRACIKDNRRRYCMRPTPDRPLAQCIEDVDTQCAKAYQVCMGAPPPPAEAAAGAPSAVSACDALFAQVRQLAPISMFWTTNYYAHAVRYMGVTAIDLKRQGPTLQGEGVRLRFFAENFSSAGPILERQTIGSQPSSAQAAREAVSVLIGADGRVMFQGIYGPYVPRCTGGRFAVVETGDSVETFNFNIPMH